MAPPNISTSSTVASFVKEPSERNKAFVTFLANGFVLMCSIQIHSPKPNMERRSEEKAENGNNNGYSMEEKKISDIFESQEVPSWKDQLTLRAFVVSFVLGVLFTFTLMKLNLTTGIIPSLNVSAGLLGFFFIKTWSKFLERLGMLKQPFTRQENTVIQTCVVATSRIAFSVLVLLFINTPTVLCDIGTAASYGPPYTPTTCYGNRHGQFPPGNMFVAVSVGLWDNGAACGRRYRLRCLSGPNRPCKDGTIDVEVVDLCSLKPCPATMLMSKDAYAAVSTLQGRKINIEFAQ